MSCTYLRLHASLCACIFDQNAYTYRLWWVWSGLVFAVSLAIHADTCWQGVEQVSNVLCCLHNMDAVWNKTWMGSWKSDNKVSMITWKREMMERMIIYRKAIFNADFWYCEWTRPVLRRRLSRPRLHCRALPLHCRRIARHIASPHCRIAKRRWLVDFISNTFAVVHQLKKWILSSWPWAKRWGIMMVERLWQGDPAKGNSDAPSDEEYRVEAGSIELSIKLVVCLSEVNTINTKS